MVGLGRFLHIAVRGMQPSHTDVPASRRPRQGHRSALVLYFRTYRATRRTIAGDSTAYQSRDYGFTDTDTYASIVVLVECPKPCVYMSCCAPVRGASFAFGRPAHFAQWGGYQHLCSRARSQSYEWLGTIRRPMKEAQPTHPPGSQHKAHARYTWHSTCLRRAHVGWCIQLLLVLNIGTWSGPTVHLCSDCSATGHLLQLRE